MTDSGRAPTPEEVAAARLKIAIAASRGRPVEPWVHQLVALGDRVREMQPTKASPSTGATGGSLETDSGQVDQDGSAFAEIVKALLREPPPPLPLAGRLVPGVAAVMNALVLFEFFADIFNVDAAHPVGVPSAVSVLAAFLVVQVSHSWLSMTGHRLGVYRGELRRAIEVRLLDSLTRITLIISGGIAILLGTLTYQVVNRQVADGGASSGISHLVGVLFGVLALSLNATVVFIYDFAGFHSRPRR